MVRDFHAQLSMKTRLYSCQGCVDLGIDTRVKQCNRLVSNSHFVLEISWKITFAVLFNLLIHDLIPTRALVGAMRDYDCTVLKE